MSGKAIVALVQRNIIEIMGFNHNAVLFDPLQAVGLAMEISRLCDDKALRKMATENARQTIAQQRLSWHTNAQRVTRLFDDILSRA